jgi:hypothetical protein
LKTHQQRWCRAKHRTTSVDLILNFFPIRDLLFNKIPGFAWRGFAAPSKTWNFIGILFYGKPLTPRNALLESVSRHI